MAKRIEAALNQGRNGYYLYEHISFCDPVNYGAEEPLQYISGDKEKMVVYHFVNRLTGYDIGELENRNGKFYTPDGKDLWEVLKRGDDRAAYPFQRGGQLCGVAADLHRDSLYP